MKETNMLKKNQTKSHIAEKQEGDIFVMQWDTIVKVILNSLCQKLPKGLPIKLKNRFFSNRKHQKTNFFEKK